ncbi:hypothetical protein EGH21_00695 [Halomicroarcula sp. F13]|uniref:Uncharacterized protein n=1 Tax=Haloarcula rubra TaxID=2487747 RepID=A0AAW4PKD4_9EURY|nr:hypothetical protein [Halomicroarcula rubra]MBX0321536.1 hypothetical protein [Halomicroarcula rubra]
MRVCSRGPTEWPFWTDGAGAAERVAATYVNVEPSNEYFDTGPEFDYVENAPVDREETVVGSEDYGEYRNVEVDATQYKFAAPKTG